MSATPASTRTTPDTPTTCALNNQIPDEYWEEVSEACAGDVSYEHEGKYFCVMHYPSQAKISDFRVALKIKLANNDFNFYGVYFPEEVDFDDKTSSKRVNFSYANFCGNVSFAGVRFSDGADFSYAILSGNAYFSYSLSFNRGFSYATFCDKADFSHVTFSGAVNFTSAKFHGMTDFSNTIFSGLTEFTTTEFLKEINFYKAQFKDYVKFKNCIFGEKAALIFDSLKIEKPERLSFHSVQLRPHWFINTDPRKFEFIDVDWGKVKKELKNELASAQRTEQLAATLPKRLLSKAYRELAVNAEENHRYNEAMDFRYASMETSLFNPQKKWREDWVKKRWGKYSFETFSWWWEYVAIRKLFSTDWWYKTLSHYGESPTRAAIVLILILVFSCAPYWFTDFASSKDITQNKIGKPIPVLLAPEQNLAKQFLATLVYSLETASLQKPEPRPVTTMARLFVGLETILAPLQAALLALAIRRKYMR